MNENEGMKYVKVEYEIWEKLMRYKLDNKKKSIAECIREIFDFYEKNKKIWFWRENKRKICQV